MDIFDFVEKRTVNLDNVFSTAPSTEKGDLDTNFRKFGHLMEKKVSLWWDIATHEQYIKDKMVPRRLRWEVPICDGLVDQEGVNEWYKFFNDKGMDLVHFALKRKQRKLQIINQHITECKSTLEPFKDTAPFTTLTKQLNKVLEQKDIEIKQRKKRKYLRDTNDYHLEQVFNWQVNLKQGKTESIASSPEREVRIITPRRESNYRTPERRPRTPDGLKYERQPEIEQSRTYRDDDGPRTPKPWWKNRTKNKSPRRPYWKNNGNKRNNKPYQSPRNYLKPYQSPNNRMNAPQYYREDNRRNNGYVDQARYYQQPRDYQTNNYRTEPREYYQYAHRNESRDYHQNPERNEQREYQQYTNGEEYREYQSNRNRNEGGGIEQSRHEPTRSPIQTNNRYEPLREYNDEEQSRSFLEYRRNEDPHKQEHHNKEKSPNRKGDAEQDGKSKRKREY